MDQNQAQNWGLAITPRIEVNHIGGQILASHLLRQGYGIVDCNQMCYLEVMELTGYHFPRTARDAEAGWVVIGLRAITIRCLMVYFLIMIALQIVLRHLGGGPHHYKNSKWARWLVLQLEDQGLKHLHFRRALRYLPVKAAAASPSFGSPSSFSEFDTWESTRQQPYFLPGRHSRRSHLSKAVYPMLFHNPVSDFETFDDAQASSLGRSTPGEDRISPSYWHEDGLYREDKFYRALAELQKLEASPDLNTSSRRDGFRWSNASSYDLGFDGERCVITDNTDREETASPHGRGVDQKCGICGKLLQQKSPWSSHRILRGNDMPIAGVLPCSHVFHADCLEHMTPKTQIHDPPCPLCLKYLGPTSESPFVKESLQMALRSLRRSRGVVIDEDLLDQNDKASAHTKDRLKKKWPWVVQRWNIGGSSLGNQLKRHLLFKGSSSKDLCHKRVSDKASSSSSKLPVVDHVFSSSPVSSS
ncbi:hypothetical protein EUGRSUZ_A02078 [Eucalyptus grandis]|uniref:Uncharacterized protein n=2 Tax=Eucalyptus grandis TaxID=71139 RepID=A0ACC3M623_EUCGR|nr:hypothetical protein EUGRSUZ_A02078 [Eucalyptus grandis]